MEGDSGKPPVCWGEPTAAKLSVWKFSNPGGWVGSGAARRVVGGAAALPRAPVGRGLRGVRAARVARGRAGEAAACGMRIPGR